jgi:hypothetical protein
MKMSNTAVPRTVRYAAISMLCISVLKAAALVYLEGLGSLQHVLWFCTFFLCVYCCVLLFASIRTLTHWTTIVFVFAVPAQTIWIIGYIAHMLGLFVMTRLHSVTALVSVDATMLHLFVYGVTVVQHIVLLPLLTFFLYKLGLARTAWVDIICITVLFLCVSFFVSSDNANVNCIRHSCDVISMHSGTTYDLPYFAAYTFFWLTTFCGMYGLLLVAERTLRAR